ncbi:MAG: trypsin-like peptidase domain-containing protein [Clostridium sp.]|nr:trypsin-like peptidase domain-containing protein [Clostridium sp.]
MNRSTKKIAGLGALLTVGAFCMSMEVGCTADAQNRQAEPAAPAVQVVAPSGMVDLTYAAESTVNAVVYIKVTTNSKTRTEVVRDPFAEMFGDFFGFGGGAQQRQIQTPKREASGSGVIISSDGYIVTNNHVVAGADVLDVKLNDHREFKARLIGTDEKTDLALIKIEGKDLPTVPIGNSDDLKLGQWVLAVGNPFNLTSTVTAGIVSAKARSLGANSVESFIQTDAAINAGNSGGALVNERGELVGINAMLYSQTGSYSGYGFAIPTTIMNKVVADLKEYGIVQRATLGVAGSDLEAYVEAERRKGNEVDMEVNSGVYIIEVEENMAAAEIGLKKGDVIVGIDDRQISKMSELQEELAKHRPGDKIKITYMRDKKKVTKTVTLRNAEGNTKIIESVDLDLFGAVLTPVSDNLKSQLALPYGLVVSALKNGKMQEAGAFKGMIILQVNDRPMRSVEDFEDAVRVANQSSDRTLWIRAVTPSGSKRSLVIELSENEQGKGKRK